VEPSACDRRDVRRYRGDRFARLVGRGRATGTAVAKYLLSAKVTPQQGLAAAESQGQPISGRFEVDEGHFQLSVYTGRGGKF